MSRIWGLQNREAPIRLIEDTALGPEAVSNVELKCLDSTINPYIALTAIAQAGMLGLQNSTRLPPKCQADPSSLVCCIHAAYCTAAWQFSFMGLLCCS